MALPAFQFLKQRLSRFDAVRGGFGFLGNFNGSTRLLLLPAGREVLYVGGQVGAVLIGEGQPMRHVGVNQAAADAVVDVFVQRQSTGWSRAAAEGGHREIPRFGIDPLSAFALPIAQRTVAPN